MDEPAHVGCQEPTIRVVPHAGVAYSDGDDAADLCAHYWFTPDPWQRDILRDWLARDDDGRLAVITAGLSVPRQNGKNGVAEAFEYYLLLTDPNVHVLHTAHLVKTCKKAFNRLVRIFSDRRHPEIASLVRSIRRTNGEEGIYLWHPDHVGDEAFDGASIEYSARSRGSARGFDKISHVVYDEAQELTDDQVEALMFTLGASETDRFVLYQGTPPGPNCPGDVFRRTRQRALTDPSPHMSWHEWGVSEKPPDSATFDDVEPLVWRTNPGMGVRLSLDFTREEFANATVEGFARERLGWWSPVSAAVMAVDREAWGRCRIDAIGDDYAGASAFGLKFSPDGSTYALVGCKLTHDRRVGAVEHVESGSTSGGVRPLAEALASRASSIGCVVVDGANGAGALCERMADLRVPRGYVVRPRTGDVVTAAQALADSVKDGTCVHTRDPEMDEGARLATRRPIGTSGGWGIDGSTCLEAASLALWGARQTKRRPGRRQRIL